MATATAPRLLTIPEVAERLGRVHRMTVYRRIASGELPAVNIGQRGRRPLMRVTEAALTAYIAGRTRVPRRTA